MDTGNKTFENFDEHDLSIVLQQVRRRLTELRYETPDAMFWINALTRMSKWLAASPTLTEQEKEVIRNPPDGLTTGRIRAIKMLRERTGMRLRACQEIVNKWMTDNSIPILSNISGGSNASI